MKTKPSQNTNWPGQVSVVWKDSVWFPPVLAGSQRSHPRNKRGHWPVQIITDPTVCGARSFNEPFMKTTQPKPRRKSAFTLIELLVVIAIIAILAAILLPALGAAKRQAMAKDAKAKMALIGAAIQKYEADNNGRFPVPPGIQLGGNDVTFGSGFNGAAPQIPGLGTVISIPTNAAIIAILRDEVTYGNGQPTPNKDHALNLRRDIYLSAKQVSDVTSQGVGPDGEYRDPWGNPYIISLDMSVNEKCRDALYSRAALHTGNGLKGLVRNPDNVNPNNATDPNQYEYSSQYLIWSKGPDGQADTNPSNSANGRADKGVNKDNVLGWTD